MKKALFILLIIPFALSGCRHLASPASTSAPESKQEAAQDQPAQEESADDMLAEEFTDSQNRFSFRHPEYVQVSEQDGGAFYIFHEESFEMQGPPDARVQIHEMDIQEWVNDRRDNDREVETEQVEGEHETMTKAVVSYPLPQDPSVTARCEHYLIEDGESLYQLAAWECFDIDYLEDMALSFEVL